MKRFIARDSRLQSRTRESLMQQRAADPILYRAVPKFCIGLLSFTWSLSAASLSAVGLGRSRRERRSRRVDLRKTLFVLPNLVTLASIFCGFNAMRVVATDNPSTGDFYRAAILLMFAMLFDLLDGRIARMTRTQSAFGLQLDSLADIISFGAAPSLLMYKWMLWRLPGGAFIAFLFTACGAIRLARFNVMSSGSTGAPLKPSPYTVGLPIPPASGILISLLLADYAVGGALSDQKYTITAACVTVALSLLMVSNIKFRAFKDLRFNIGTALLVLFAIGSSAVVWQFTKPQFVLIWLLGIYILIGLFETVRSLALRLRRSPDDETTDAEGTAH
jgi:CDP-diacylglycerol---serine O-phosphatidyltransferase